MLRIMMRIMMILMMIDGEVEDFHEIDDNTIIIYYLDLPSSIILAIWMFIFSKNIAI